MLNFSKETIFKDLLVTDAESAIRTLADRLHTLGWVKADYGQATIQREMDHPTGLPTKPYCMAFPHADADGVIQSALAIALLQKPVPFKNMGDPDETLEVYVVILLANKNPEEQIQTLRNLAILFGQPEKLVELRDLPNVESIFNWVKNELAIV